MRAKHLEILVEEPSMEAFLRKILPPMLGETTSFQIYPSQCKDDLLAKLPDRLQGYANWLPEDWRIIVVVDRDDDCCQELKYKLEQISKAAKLDTRTITGEKPWQIVNRIAIEELEAWYFGDWDAVRNAYPRVRKNTPDKASFRSPDAITGGTWEAFERILQRARYFKNGLRKIEAAKMIGQEMNAQRNTSHSFQVFRNALLEASITPQTILSSPPSPKSSKDRSKHPSRQEKLKALKKSGRPFEN